MAKVSKEFAESFLGPKGKIMTGALAGSIGGGSLFAVYVALIKGPLAVGRAISRFVDGLIRLFTTAIDRYYSIAIAEISSTWDPFQLGWLSLPANLVVAIVAFAVMAIGVRILVG